MPRPEKVEAVATIKERLEGSRAVFVTEYAGLSVKQQQKLRRGLRGSNAEYKVVKMTLARRAADELGLQSLEELLIGPTALAFADGDPVETAKVLRDFAGENPALLVKGALLGGQLLPPEKVSELADIAPREVLLSRIAGAFQAPMANMAGLMTAFFRNSATVFQQLLEKKEAADAGGPVEDDSAAAADESAAAPAAEAEEAAAAADDAPDADGAAEADAVEETGADEAPAAEVADVEPGDEPSAPEATADDGDDADEAPAAEVADVEPEDEPSAPEATADDGDDADEASTELSAAADEAAAETEDEPADEAEEDK